MIELLKHQDVGADWLVDRDRAYLADPPGMGKTYTVLEALKRMSSQHALIVCPAIVQSHWRHSAREIDFEGRLSVYSYEMLTRGGMPLMAKLVLNEKIDAFVPDEAHYCKHATSQRTKIVMGRDGYARRVPHVILASGTPMPKNPAELFTQLVFLAPDVLVAFGVGTYEKWVDAFCVMQKRWVRGKLIEKVVDAKNADLLKTILDEIMLRREGGADLPEIWWQQVRLDGPTNEPEMHDERVISLVKHAIESGTLEEIANDPHVSRMRRRIGELKVAPVVEMLSSQLADSTEKVAVFAYHTSVLHGLRDGLAQFGVAYIDGSVSSRNRELALSEFQNNPRTRVFIGQSTATGTGFDGLQYATHRAINVEPDWTADNNMQLAKRLARMGQSHSTTIMQMVSLAGTLDDSIIGQNIREVKMQRKVFT